MMGGEVVEIGESDILQHPKDERVQRFVRGDME
jgi:putative ABC transport system ATP-binding protein